MEAAGQGKVDQSCADVAQLRIFVPSRNQHVYYPLIHQCHRRVIFLVCVFGLCSPTETAMYVEKTKYVVAGSGISEAKLGYETRRMEISSFDFF